MTKLPLTVREAELLIHELEDIALNALAEDTNFNTYEWLGEEEQKDFLKAWRIVHGECYLHRDKECSCLKE